ncbi:hypothetical protein OUZ56_024257 [Daphnia magna]|uniref:Uncharacterized protein n=1 Tax=Daphnia magna TaxID=35525 RepID=A0ABR0B0M6_9CRUS|nr:hypothetical protein OUZ56_024257 [Daphnia magna]
MEGLEAPRIYDAEPITNLLSWPRAPRLHIRLQQRESYVKKLHIATRMFAYGHRDDSDDGSGDNLIKIED